MISLWDLYLDVADAATVLEAVVVLERHRAVREPLPLENALLLHERLGRVARISAEDAVHWQREADDRHEAAEVDGGRWGSEELAATMSNVATELAETSRHIALVAQAAADDLAPRLTDSPSVPDDALDATAREVERLLQLDGEPDG